MDDETIPVINNTYEKPKRRNIFKYFIKKIEENLCIIFFFVMFYIDYYIEKKIFSELYTLEIEKKSYKFFSTIFFLITVTIYITLLIKSPAQTNIELILENEPYRIIPNTLKDSYPKFCEFCNNQKKFIRSSHCRICNCCILRRDHHCVFLNKCVGYNNNKLFLLYLIYQLIFASFYLRGFITFYTLNYKDFTYSIFNIFIVISTLITIYLYYMVLGLLIQMIYSYLIDYTVYEDYSNKKGTNDKFSNKKNINVNRGRNIYDKGWLVNIINILGPSIFHFFLPLPHQIKCNFPEENLSFKENALASAGEMTRDLSGIVFDTIENIIKSNEESTNPLKFMELSKKDYELPNIEII